MERELYISTNTASGPNSTTRTEPFVKIIALVATLGGLLFGYDTGVVSGALLFMRGDLQLTPFTTGLVTSSLLFGAAFGALIAGHFADAMGRRKIIISLAFIFALGAIGSAFAPDVITMIASRLFLGIAVGGAAATVPVYIAEIAPANKRGQLVTLQELMIVSGQLLAYVSNATFNEIWGGEHTWRWMIAISTVPAVLLWFGMIFMPESPRWHVMRGNTQDARKVLEKTRAADDVDWELEEIEETIEENRQKGKGRLRDLRTPWLRKVFLLGIGIAAIQQLTGVNTIMYYAPTMLTATGLSNDAALFATIANGVISVLMTLVGIWMIGKIGRRPLVLVGQMGCTACLFFIAAVCFFMPEYHQAGEVNLVRAYLVLAGMLMFLCFQQGALSPVTWLLLSEIFPARMRGICMGGAVFALWMANFAISMAFPLLLAAFGLAGAFLTFAVIGIGGSMFVLRTIPETKGRSLEQVEHYFYELYNGKP